MKKIGFILLIIFQILAIPTMGQIEFTEIGTEIGHGNGKGMAIGDLNNDTLPDIVIANHKSKNKVWLNKGNTRFEEIIQIFYKVIKRISR